MHSWHMQGEMEESGVTKDSIYQYAGWGVAVYTWKDSACLIPDVHV